MPDASLWVTLRDATTAVFLVVGALMSLAAAVGMLRFPDLMSRMHAATKPQVLGLLLMLAAVALQIGSWSAVPVLVLAWLLQLVTAPVSAHMVGRAGYRTKHLRRSMLVNDDLGDVVEHAAGRERDRAAHHHGGALHDQAAPDDRESGPERESAADDSRPR
ncbi:hypothetical protein GCM10022377_16910 [Zhihengliuella alba]|uniref:Monovalent cation/H(+) antiporter subunit G n=1 Tax=Zhihengliuella alba TaxID=547018 RepID=A0ABP7DFP7_9MICC